ncbi:hypothetical protein CCACVL1_10014 [Corchorus capsularis]|uniref:Uncharacterized protein n=1 Tax=Corchorus capsularis TaxID=210143 RepID=A0A1R3IT41_COCAP|nr:hypothetical protein CCACVL1_10014 [Corchorus capsularis]
MASAGYGGVGLAEVYVMRSLHKQKTKKLERAKSDDKVVVGGDEKFPSGCFFWVSKKTHSNSQVASAAVDDFDST